MQQETTHQKPKSKHRRRLLPNGRPVFVIVTAVVVLLLGWQVISAFAVTNETTPAVQVTVNDSIFADGWFFRDETTITGGTGDSIKHIVYSGERVQQNAALAVVYADEQALMLSRELDPLENRIALLDTALQSATDGADAAKIDQMIILQLQQMAAQAKSGTGSALSTASNTLRTLVLRREAGNADSAAITAERDVLLLEQSSLNAQLAGHTTQLTAPTSGYFSEVVDGYEDILTLDVLEDLTTEQFHELTGSNPQKDDASLGKMIEGFSWYLVSEITTEHASRFYEGQSLRVNFTQATIETPVTVHAVLKERGADTALLVLEGTEFNSEMVSMRQQPVEIILATYTGLKVPKKAVRIQESTDSSGNTVQQTGVFILSGSFQKFKVINTLYEADDFYVVEQSATNVDMLVEQDQIIIRGKNLQNNMVVKK